MAEYRIEAPRRFKARLPPRPPTLAELRDDPCRVVCIVDADPPPECDMVFDWEAEGGPVLRLIPKGGCQ